MVLIVAVHNGTIGCSDKHAMSRNVEHPWKSWAVGRARIDNVDVSGEPALDGFEGDGRHS